MLPPFTHCCSFILSSFTPNFSIFIFKCFLFAYSYSFSVSAPVYQFGLDLIFFLQSYIISLICANGCCTFLNITN